MSLPHCRNEPVGISTRANTKYYTRDGITPWSATDWLRTSSVEKDLGILVHRKLNRNQLGKETDDESPEKPSGGHSQVFCSRLWKDKKTMGISRGCLFLVLKSQARHS